MEMEMEILEAGDRREDRREDRGQREKQKQKQKSKTKTDGDGRRRTDQTQPDQRQKTSDESLRRKANRHSQNASVAQSRAQSQANVPTPTQSTAAVRHRQALVPGWLAAAEQNRSHPCLRPSSRELHLLVLLRALPPRLHLRYMVCYSQHYAPPRGGGK